MSKKLLAWAVGALALVLASSAFQPAEARRGGHHGHHGHGHHGHGHHGHHHFGHHGFRHHHHGFHHRRFHRHRHIFVEPYGYAYSGDCYWLRRRALYTGSPYWWSRYYACINYY